MAPAAGCPDAELLALYAEHGLGAGDQALVEAHLDSCPRCQAIVAACVRALPEPTGAAPHIPGVSPEGAASSWFAGWRWLVPVASVAAVAVVAVWIGRAPADDVAREGQAREFSRPAAPPPLARTPADTTAAEDTRAGAAREGDPGRPGAVPSSDAAAASPVPQQERRALRLEDGQAKATTAEPVATARELAEAVAAEERPREQTAPRERAEAAPATEVPAPTAGMVTPPPAGTVTPPAAPARAADVDAATARASGAGAGTARNQIGAVQGEARGIVTGTLRYRERVTLPAGAEIEVRLLDVSRADAPSAILARTQIVTRGEQGPVAFSLPYDPTAIEARRRYVVDATIAVNGRVVWRTTTQHAIVIEGAAPAAPVTIVVDRVR